MRNNILIAGALVLAVSILLFNSEIVASVFGLALGSSNLFIGILTPKSVGIAVRTEELGSLKLSLDKGVIKTSIYSVAFSDKKLVLRKLSSASLTVATALILSLLGAVLAGPFGIVAGGVTAFSLQEFVTQRRRSEIMQENILDPSGGGDLEFPYDEIEHVQLLRNRIQIHLKDRVVRITISKKSSGIIAPALERIIPAKIQSSSAPSERAP